MDLISILTKRVAPNDTLTLERKQLLCRELNRLSQSQASTAFILIRNYKIRCDNVRRVGDSENSIPYYGIDIDKGIEFSIEEMPEGLLLILEQLIASNLSN